MQQVSDHLALCVAGADPGFSERGGSDKPRVPPPTISKCYCNLTSPFFTRKSMVKIIFLFHVRGFGRTTRTTPGSAPGIGSKLCSEQELLLQVHKEHADGLTIENQLFEYINYCTEIHVNLLLNTCNFHLSFGSFFR